MKLVPSLALASAAPKTGEGAAASHRAGDLEVHSIEVGSGHCLLLKMGDDGVAGNGGLDGLIVAFHARDCDQCGRSCGDATQSKFKVPTASARIRTLQLCVEEKQ